MAPDEAVGALSRVWTPENGRGSRDCHYLLRSWACLQRTTRPSGRSTGSLWWGRTTGSPSTGCGEAPTTLSRRSLALWVYSHSMTTNSGHEQKPQWWETRNDLPPYVLEQLTFYRDQSRTARHQYQILEVILILVAASIPAAAAVGASRGTLGVLGAVTAVLTGLRSLFQWQQNAASFAQTWMQIEGEVIRFDTDQAPYDRGDKTRTLLTEIGGMVQTETTAWSDRLRKRGHSEIVT